jgi:hypothetical protein
MDTGSDPNTARMRRRDIEQQSRTRQMNTTRAIATCYSTVISVRQRLSTRLGLLSYLSKSNDMGRQLPRPTGAGDIRKSPNSTDCREIQLFVGL